LKHTKEITDIDSELFFQTTHLNIKYSGFVYDDKINQKGPARDFYDTHTAMLCFHPPVKLVSRTSTYP
jgi:hypothetical protein